MAGLPLILGVDGGNSKTELVVATLDGEPVAYLRGPGSNSHTEGPARTAAFLSGLVDQADLSAPVVQGTFYLCGADIPADFEALVAVLEQQPWVERAAVDNDIFALLRAGTDDADAVAVVCGAGNQLRRALQRRAGRPLPLPRLGERRLGRQRHARARCPLPRGARRRRARRADGARRCPARALRPSRGRARRSGALRPHRAGPSWGDCARGGGSGRCGRRRRAPARRAARRGGRPHGDARACRPRPRQAAREGSPRRRHAAKRTGTALRPGSGPARGTPHATPLAVTAAPVLGAALDALDAAGAPPATAARLRAAFDSGLAPRA